MFYSLMSLVLICMATTDVLSFGAVVENVFARTLSVQSLPTAVDLLWCGAAFHEIGEHLW